MFDLFAVFDLLAKHAVFVADAVAESGVMLALPWNSRRQAPSRPEPAIAERGFDFEIPELFQVDIEIGQCLPAVSRKFPATSDRF